MTYRQVFQQKKTKTRPVLEVSLLSKHPGVQTPSVQSPRVQASKRPESRSQDVQSPSIQVSRVQASRPYVQSPAFTAFRVTVKYE